MVPEVTAGYVEETHGNERKQGVAAGVGLGFKISKENMFLTPKGFAGMETYSTPTPPGGGTNGNTLETKFGGGVQVVGGVAF